ncbi:hypothetical protein FPSE_10643 [Fusarium pseudograminearum CS3096]|uniref:Ubiquitin 3 binding protein But2 C-terminal domain-containing protein n=1 Tax=Fusarium pseudograminearum (strain CS3096) TaxID=1028729 RepID=K3VAJ7_FUSPC|nr:hypothetical protein FPSE_10643 [Fusarium pseudograminearum CS3096]EKJ69178.1 hypothetical protein FPSE_10643 [Fusarium pseudograminearum CS3096]
MYSRRFIAVATLIGSCVASPCKPHSSFGTTTIATFNTIEATSTTDTTDSWSAIETTTAFTDTAAVGTYETSTWSAEILTFESTTTVEPTTTTAATETTKNVELTTTTTAVDAPTPLTTFTLKVGNSVQMDLNGETIKIRDRDPYFIFLKTSPAVASQYQTATFSVEPSTNYLKIGNLYVVAAAAPHSSLSAASSLDRTSYIICTPPVAAGETLACVVQGTTRTQWMVVTGTGEKALFIRDVGSNDGFDNFDMIVG